MLISQPLLAAVEATAQSGTGSEESWFWNLLIALVVLAATAASAALPIAALRQWQGPWRVSAGFSLIVLAVWLGLIFVSRMLSPEAHRFWTLEIFAWAMLNMIYMVALMTIKRMIEKADKENTLSD